MSEDRADIMLRRWVAEAQLVELTHELAEIDDLSPALVEAVEDACREDDFGSIVEALIDLLHAVRAQGPS